MNIISESGLYTLIMRSNKPEAKRFRKWVTSEVLPAIRKMGVYGVKDAGAAPEDADAASRAKRLELQEGRLNVQRARMLQRMIERAEYSISDEVRQMLVYEATWLTTGRTHPEILAPEPERLFSAVQVGKPLGVSNRKVMKLARLERIIAPEGLRNQYGVWKQMPDPHSGGTVLEWFFNEAGSRKIAERFNIIEMEEIEAEKKRRAKEEELLTPPWELREEF